MTIKETYILTLPCYSGQATATYENSREGGEGGGGQKGIGHLATMLT